MAITHFHIDHHGDLPSLIFAWKYGYVPARSMPVEIIGPVGLKALLDRLAAAYGEWVTTPGYPLTVREIGPNDVVELSGGVQLTWSTLVEREGGDKPVLVAEWIGRH